MAQLDASARKRALIVEDQEVIAEMYQLTLEGMDFEVTLAKDGAAGYLCSSTQAFDLIITDLAMPNVTGVELLLEILGMPHAALTQVFVISGYLNEPLLPKQIPRERFHYFTKPISMKELREAVSEHVLGE